MPARRARSRRIPQRDDIDILYRLRDVAGGHPFWATTIDVLAEALEGFDSDVGFIPPPPPPPPPPSHRGRPEGVRNGTQVRHVPSRIEEAACLLGVRPDAPREVIEAAHRALARKHHPDVGGDTGAMQRLNAARATLLAQRG